MSSRPRSSARRAKLPITTSNSSTTNIGHSKGKSKSSQSARQPQEDDLFEISSNSAIPASNGNSLASKGSYPKITTMFHKKTKVSTHEASIGAHESVSENLPNSSSRLTLASPTSTTQYHPCDEAVAEEGSTLFQAHSPSLNFENDESSIISPPPSTNSKSPPKSTTTQGIDSNNATLDQEDTTVPTSKRPLRDLPSRSTRLRKTAQTSTKSTHKQSTEKKASSTPVRRHDSVTIVIDSPSPPPKMSRAITSPRPRKSPQTHPKPNQGKVTSVPSLIDLMEFTEPSKAPSPSRKEEISDPHPTKSTVTNNNVHEDPSEAIEKNIQIPSSFSSLPLPSHLATPLIRIAIKLGSSNTSLESLQSDLEGLIASQEKKFNFIFTRFKLTGRCFSSYSANVDRLVNSISVPIAPSTASGGPQNRPPFSPVPPTLQIGPVTPIIHSKAKSIDLHDISPLNLSSKLSSEAGKRSGKRNRVAWCPSPSSTIDTSLTLDFDAAPTQIIGEEGNVEGLGPKRKKIAEYDLASHHASSYSQYEASLSMPATPTQLLTPTQRTRATQAITPTQPLRSTPPSSGPSSPTQMLIDNHPTTPRLQKSRTKDAKPIPKSALFLDEEDDESAERSTQLYESHDLTQIIDTRDNEMTPRVRQNHAPSSPVRLTDSDQKARKIVTSLVERAISLSEWISTLQPALFSALIDMHWTSHFTLDHDGNMDSSSCISPENVNSIMSEAHHEAKALKRLKIVLVERFIKFNFSSPFIAQQLQSLPKPSSDEKAILEMLRYKVDLALGAEKSNDLVTTAFKLLLSFLYISESLLNALENAERHVLKTSSWNEEEARKNIKSFLLPNLLQSIPSLRDISTLVIPNDL